MQFTLLGGMMQTWALFVFQWFCNFFLSFSFLFILGSNVNGDSGAAAAEVQR